MPEAYIVACARAAGGRRGGRLAGWHPPELAAQVLDALVERTGVDPALIDDVIMGCVSQVGPQSVNIARNAILSSSLPESVPGTSVDRQCGSSQQAVHFAAQAVMSGTQDIVIAAGVESMTRVPMGSASRLAVDAGLGNYYGEAIDKRYNKTRFNQFVGAEMLVAKYGLDKDALDQFAFDSHRKAAAATQQGRFDAEIVPVAVSTAAGACEQHRVDEGIRFDVTLEGIRNVKLLREDGSLTAATSSQICDGAAAVMIVSEAGLKRTGLQPLARVHHLTVLGGDPVIMLETPIAATERALQRAGLTLDEIDLYEVNEAFASVPMAWQKKLGADPGKLNVNGGAIALGHPLGATGAKLMTTLVHELRRRGGRYGLQAICEGGGLSNVTVIERL